LSRLAHASRGDPPQQPAVARPRQPGQQASGNSGDGSPAPAGGHASANSGDGSPATAGGHASANSGGWPARASRGHASANSGGWLARASRGHASANSGDGSPAIAERASPASGVSRPPSLPAPAGTAYLALGRNSRLQPARHEPAVMAAVCPARACGCGLQAAWRQTKAPS